MIPAAIRYKNPGAIWPSSRSIKWGSLADVTLKDGQSNHIAVMPTYVAGICLQLDTWLHSANYRDKRLIDALRIWSGNNSPEGYCQSIIRKVPSVSRDTIMNEAFWRGPDAIPFLKAQAAHEAGETYPAPDADWIRAYQLVMGIAPTTPMPHELPPAPQPEPSIFSKSKLWEALTKIFGRG